jgi:hypothetical protein
MATGCFRPSGTHWRPNAASQCSFGLRRCSGPPQAQNENMQINDKPSQQPPMAPVAQCHLTAAAQIQTQSLSRHNSSGILCTQQPVAQAAFNHQPHMPLNAVTQIQTAVPRTASTNQLPPPDPVQNMGINPMAPTVQLHPCHPTAVTQIQAQSMARHNSSGMRTQQPQTMSTRMRTKLMEDRTTSNLGSEKWIGGTTCFRGSRPSSTLTSRSSWNFSEQYEHAPRLISSHYLKSKQANIRKW